MIIEQMKDKSFPLKEKIPSICKHDRLLKLFHFEYGL